MDLSTTIIPKSDQINAEDLLTGPVTVTITSVTRGGAEQPVDVHLAEYPGRAYRPSKTMRKVMVKVWGQESDTYTGNRMTLYRDPDVKWGGQKVGGIKISHMSGIDKAVSLALTETKGKRALHTIEPLRDVPAPAKPDPAAAAIAHYEAAFNVNQADLERYLEAPADEWTPKHLAGLRALSGALTNGTHTVDDVFPPATLDGAA